MATHSYQYTNHHNNIPPHKDALAAFFPSSSPTMHHDQSFHQSSPPASASQSGNSSNLQNQLSMNMFSNMMQIQNLNDQLVGMVGQGPQSPTASNVQYNPQAIFEQQFKLNQLQQLQQLQNQIFQQQIALISGQSTFISTSPSNNIPLSPLKDTNSTHNSVQSSFSGLPTPGPSSELRPRDGAMEFVSPMILNQNSFMDSPISPQSTHPNDNPFSNSHQHPDLHGHPHTAPPQIAFEIQSHPASPVFSAEHETPSSALSNASVMPGGDIDLSPITSPWLGATSNRRHSQPAIEPGMVLHRSASFSHHLPQSMRTKRPAGSDMTDHSNPTVDIRANGSESSEPLRKKLTLASPSTLRGHDHPQQQVTSLNLIPQPPASPMVSPTSPFSPFTSSNLIPGAGTSGHNTASTSSSSGPQRRGYRDRVSKSVSNTPLLRGQRTRVGSITRTSTNGGNVDVNPGSITMSPHMFGVKGTSPSKPNTPSTSAVAGGAGLSVVGFDIGDTPSPVDLDMSMPPPAPPEQFASTNSTTGSSGSRSDSGIRSSPNPGPPGTNGMGVERHLGDQLLPATPASIMNLGRNPTSAGNDEKGQIQTIQLGQQQPQKGLFNSSTASGQEESAQDLDQERKAKMKAGGDKEKESSGKGRANAGSAVSSIATSRSRRNTTALASAAGMSSGLKAILPANSPDVNAFSPTTSSRLDQQIQQQPRKTSHKAAEQKRRDSLKSTFDDLRTLLPPIPLPSEMDESATGAGGVIPSIPGAWPPRSSSQLPGSLPPRGPPKTGADGPNKGVSKLQLLICGNEYIRVLRSRIDRRDEEIGRLRNEVGRLRDLFKDLKLGDPGVRDKDGDIDLFHADFEFDSDLDLERDLDAVELQARDGHGGGGEKGGLGGGVGMGTGAASVGISVNALGSVGERPDEEDDCD